MLTLYSYPTLFGVVDNNGCGLKVFAFLKLTGVPFVHEHTFDASQAPRQQPSIYGFIANTHLYSIETPLKKFVTSRSNLVRHCTAIHRLVGSDPRVSQR